MSRVGCRGGRESQPQLPHLICLCALHFHSTLFPRPFLPLITRTLDTRHFLLIVPIDLVRIPMISSTNSTRCLIISGASQCPNRSYRPLVSRAEPRAKSRKRAYSTRLSRPKKYSPQRPSAAAPQPNRQEDVHHEGPSAAEPQPKEHKKDSPQRHRGRRVRSFFDKILLSAHSASPR